MVEAVQENPREQNKRQNNFKNTTEKRSNTGNQSKASSSERERQKTDMRALFNKRDKFSRMKERTHT